MRRGIRKTFLFAAAAASLALAAGASAASPPENPGGDAALRRCIDQNQFRYSQPDQAAVLQYIDIVALCRAILARGGDVQVQITPLVGGPATSTPRAVAAPGTTGGADAPFTPPALPARKSGSASGGSNNAARPASASVARVEAALLSRTPARDAGLLGDGPRLRIALGVAVAIAGAAMLAAVATRRRRR